MHLGYSLKFINALCPFQLTIADILLYQRFAGISDFLGPEAAKSFLENDKLKAHSERVAAYPGIKEWIEKRPKTER